MTLGIGALAYRRYKKRKKKKEEEKKSDEKKEKKGFRDTRYGQALKWTGIGGAVYYVSRGLITGKRNLWGRDPLKSKK